MGQIIGVIVILGLGISILGALIYVGMRENSGADPLQARLAEYADREVPATLEDLEMSLSFRDRVVMPLVKGLATMLTRFTPEQQVDATRKQLGLAGRALMTDRRAVFATRILLTLI